MSQRLGVLETGTSTRSLDDDVSIPVLDPLDEPHGITVKNCCTCMSHKKSFLERYRNPGIGEAKEISIFSIVLTLITFVLGITFAVIGNSSATLSYALESLVDVVSSVLVLWRFWGDDSTDSMKVQKRESRASFLISISFILLAIVVFGDAVKHLASRQPVTDPDLLIALSAPSAIILLVLGGMKLHISRVLASGAMRKDALCSFAAGMLSVGIFTGVVTSQVHEDVWWLDAAFAIVISTGLFVFAVYSVRQSYRRSHYPSNEEKESADVAELTREEAASMQTELSTV